MERWEWGGVGYLKSSGRGGDGAAIGSGGQERGQGDPSGELGFEARGKIDISLRDW